MPMDQGRDPWSGDTYKGFARGPAGQAGAQPTAHRPPSGLLAAAGVAAALLLGVGLGFLARPELIGRAPPAAPGAAPPAALASPGAAQVPIAIASPPPAQAAPRPRGKLQTLPPEMAAAERGSAQPDAASEAGETAPPNGRASFDCATARPGAEQLVCSDPQLAAQDRRLARAYRRALASGVDPVDLRQEQQDWTAIREDAARRSSQAVAQIYDQRIAELNRMADAAGDDSGDGDADDGQ
jgi:uncharacterized protein YecT (DUF1311 family)